MAAEWAAKDSAGIPTRIVGELTAAAQRTGITPELERAKRQIKMLLALSPQRVERLLTEELTARGGIV